jgi:hypothetical protein
VSLVCVLIAFKGLIKTVSQRLRLLSVVRAALWPLVLEVSLFPADGFAEGDRVFLAKAFELFAPLWVAFLGALHEGFSVFFAVFWIMGIGRKWQSEKAYR